MQFTNNESEYVFHEKKLVQRNIDRMCLAKDYNELWMNCMFAKAKIDAMYDMLHNHLVTEGVAELKKQDLRLEEAYLKNDVSAVKELQEGSDNL